MLSVSRLRITEKDYVSIRAHQTNFILQSLKIINITNCCYQLMRKFMGPQNV